MKWKMGLACALLVAANHALPQVVESRPSRVRPVPPSDGPIIRAASSLVLVPVHVVNRQGATVNGLEPGSFTVFENRKPQKIVSFGNDDAPCSLGIVFDLSGSMSNKRDMAVHALRSFLETANPVDEASLLTVSTRPSRISYFTTDFALLQSQLREADAGGATALNDAVYLALNDMKTAHFSHKAILIISDGVDNHSRYTTPELLRAAEEADVQIYTIAVETWSITKKPIELAEERSGFSFLGELARRTGGLSQTVRDLGDTPQVAARLSRAIRDEYLIGYRPEIADDSGRWHSISVTVGLPQLRVASRSGYYSR